MAESYHNDIRTRSSQFRHKQMTWVNNDKLKHRNSSQPYLFSFLLSLPWIISSNKHQTRFYEGKRLKCTALNFDTSLKYMIQGHCGTITRKVKSREKILPSWFPPPAQSVVKLLTTDAIDFHCCPFLVMDEGRGDKIKSSETSQICEGWVVSGMWGSSKKSESWYYFITPTHTINNIIHAHKMNHKQNKQNNTGHHHLNEEDNDTWWWQYLEWVSWHDEGDKFHLREDYNGNYGLWTKDRPVWLGECWRRQTLLWQ